jgi:hypothetical protein
MNSPRLPVVLTAINLVLMLVLLSQFLRPAEAAPGRPEDGIAKVLRARTLEIVDEQGRVRALPAVMPPSVVDGKQYPETVLLRLVDPASGPVVKLTAAANGAALGLSDDADSGVQIFARDTGSFVKVTGKNGKEAELKPQP